MRRLAGHLLIALADRFAYFESWRLSLALARDPAWEAQVSDSAERWANGDMSDAGSIRELVDHLGT